MQNEVTFHLILILNCREASSCLSQELNYNASWRVSILWQYSLSNVSVLFVITFREKIWKVCQTHRSLCPSTVTAIAPSGNQDRQTCHLPFLRHAPLLLVYSNLSRGADVGVGGSREEIFSFPVFCSITVDHIITLKIFISLPSYIHLYTYYLHKHV